MTTLLDPQGNPVEVPESEVKVSLMSGYRAATPEDIAKAAQAQREQEEQGGIGGQAKTFAEGLADALTFGAAPWLEVKTGLTTPEAIEARKRINPGWRTAGELTGYVAPAIATAGGSVGLQGGAAVARAGAGAVAKGAVKTALEYSAPGIIEKMGAGVSKQILTHFGEGRVAKVAASVANQALQGGLSAAGQGVGRFASDPAYTAEAWLHDIGMGGAFGGAIGGTLSAGTEIALPAALRAAAAAKLVGVCN